MAKCKICGDKIEYTDSLEYCIACQIEKGITQNKKSKIKTEETKMKKFDDELKQKVFKLIKEGKTPKEVSKSFGGHPNPNAIKRWCKTNSIEFKE
jgi:hypothetical protein